MIRKFLIVGKYVYLSSSKIDDEQAAGAHNIDLMMPIKTHWDLCELLQQANYLLASQEHMADVHEVYRKIFKKAAPYAIFESDRLWLLKKSAS